MFEKILPALLIAAGLVQAAFADVPDERASGTDAAAFDKALEKAAGDASVPFGFSIHCREEDGIRSARLYPGGVAVWGGKLQIRVGSDLRRLLLNDLQSSGFSSFAPRYGGKSEAERSAGPLRVSCRVEAAVDGLQKESVQLADGEQSPALAGLAASLLDRLEPLASGGVGADSLEDGLEKVAVGALAPDILSVRLVRMPEKSSDADGDIVRIDSARWSWQAYRPGKAGAASDWNPLPAGFASEFADVVVRAQFWTLPVNVPGTGHSEIELRLLDHRKTVVSRAFTRIEPGSMTTEKERFDAVVSAIGRLRQ